MNQADAARRVDLPTENTGPSAGDGAVDRPTGGRPGPARSGAWSIAALAGLVAGVASWGAGEAALVAFEPGFRMSTEMAATIETSTAEVRRQMEVATSRTAMVSYGALAGFLGLALGWAGTRFAEGPPRRRVAAPILGLVAGLALGAVAALGLVEVFHTWFRASAEAFSKDLLKPLLLHAGMWLPAGLVGGVAFAWASGMGRRGAVIVVGGGLGAVIGAVFFEILGALVFATAKTTHPIALSLWARLLAHLCVCIAATALVLLSIPKSPEVRGVAPTSS